MAGSYDVVVIGGGHNGLVAAAYLARAGKSVCVLERRHVLGGCATTEELWPGYKVSTAAYVISLFQTAIIKELRLNDYGLKILPRNPSSFTPLPDDRYLMMGADPELCRREISKFSPKDAEAYPRYNELLERVAAAIEPVLGRTAPDPIPLPNSWRRIGLRKRARDVSKLWQMHQALAKLGEKIPEAIELLTGAARPILERWFESEALRATLATDAIIGAFSSLSAAGTAYVLLHHVMGEAGGARGVWGFVQGGMGGLANALEGACRDLRVTIRRECPVRQILVQGNTAYGVELETGETIHAKVVASSVDCHLTFEKFINPAILPDGFRQAVARIDYSSASAKINLALSQPPNFRALPSTQVQAQHHGTMHISPSMDYIERAYDDAKYGLPSQEPVLEMTMATSVDRTIAPEGKHLLSIFVQFAPYKLREGTWDQIKETFADRCLAKIEEYVPGFQQTILHRQVLSPLDLERVYGITGGNIMQGAMHLHQLYAMRPVVGWSDHWTPISGLFLCGAASHPGGGVFGACGKNAAEEILRS